MLFGKSIQKLILCLCLTLSSAFASDEVTLLNGGREALKARVDLIEKAKSSIYLSYFILEDDEVSFYLLEKLRQAAIRGVDVRILIDHMYNATPKYIATLLVNSGVKFKVFNRGSLLHLSRRMHDKLFLVDSEYAILGGRNIENTYYDQSPVGAKKNYFDRDILVKSDLVGEIEDYYLDLWSKKHVKNVKIVKKIKSDKYEAAKNLLMNAAKEDILAGQKVDTNLQVNEVKTSEIQFIHDLPQLVKDSKAGTSGELYQLIENAKESVIIDSPYFILTKDLEAVLKRTIAKGVRVRVLTNSLVATDGLLPQAAYLRDRKKIAGMGVELYEYLGDYSFHAKSAVIDGRIAMVGSYNFDPRSENLNTETAIIVNNEVVAQDLLKAMDETLEVSYRIDKDGNPIVSKGEIPRPELNKRLAIAVIKALVPLFKGQLIVGENE